MSKFNCYILLTWGPRHGYKTKEHPAAQAQLRNIAAVIRGGFQQSRVVIAASDYTPRTSCNRDWGHRETERGREIRLTDHEEWFFFSAPRVLPIAVAQLALVELAGGRARKVIVNCPH